MITNQERLLTTKEAADLLNISAGTLRIWNCQKRYPLLKSIKIGAKSVRYKLSDLKKFIGSESKSELIDSCSIYE